MASTSYYAGSFAVPALAGNVSVTGLDFGPVSSFCQGVVFFGSNQGTEDSLVYAPDAGVFMGLMALDVSSTLFGHANCLIPGQPSPAVAGSSNSTTQPIYMQVPFGTVDYAASPVSLNTDGFTVNFTNVSAGTRYVNYFAWGGWKFGATQTSGTADVGFLVQSLAHIGTALSGMGSGITFGTNWGFGSFPKSRLDDAAVSLSAMEYTNQRWTRLYDTSPGFSIGVQASPVGPFLAEANDTASVTPPTSRTVNVGGGYTPFGTWAYWDGPSDTQTTTPAASTAGTTVVNLGNNVQRPEAVFFFGANGWEGGPGSENDGTALMFGVKTETFEACVMVNDQGAGGFASPSTTGNALFQSRIRSWCSDADHGDRSGNVGVHAGTTALSTNSTLTLTTEEDDVPPYNLVLIAFGPNRHFVPGIYRRVIRG